MFTLTGVIIVSILKNDISTRRRLKGDLSTILGTLDEINSTEAVAFIKWMSKKAQLYKDAILDKPYSSLPKDIQRGDIVLCDLGINIPHEFSDKNTGKHFVMVWCQQGHNVLVIPITSKSSNNKNPYVIPIGKISGLPNMCNFAKLDALRSVSLRRLSPISGFCNGKIHSEETIDKIKNILFKLFISS